MLWLPFWFLTTSGQTIYVKGCMGFVIWDSLQNSEYGMWDMNMKSANLIELNSDKIKKLKETRRAKKQSLKTNYSNNNLNKLEIQNEGEELIGLIVEADDGTEYKIIGYDHLTKYPSKTCLEITWGIAVILNLIWILSNG